MFIHLCLQSHPLRQLVELSLEESHTSLMPKSSQVVPPDVFCWWFSQHVQLGGDPRVDLDHTRKILTYQALELLRRSLVYLLSVTQRRKMCDPLIQRNYFSISQYLNFGCPHWNAHIKG